MYDLVIKNGLLVLPDRVLPGSLLIHNGKIAGLEPAVGAENGGPDDAAQVVDASGCCVLPGAIDTHSHLNDPGYTESEDFYTGTCSAAAGGFTSVLEMPISLPVPASARLLAEKKALLEPKAVIDFGLWGGLIAGNQNELAAMADFGAVGVKGFLTEDPYYPPVNWGLIVSYLPRLAASGLPFALHCETPEVNQVCLEQLRAAGRRDPAAYPQSRPEISEILAVSSFTTLARHYPQARFYIVHSSVADSVELALAARAQGAQVYVETCPHYLALDESDLDKYGPLAVCNPPLRSRAAQEKLWQRVLAGDIDCIGSDHAPYLYEEKTRGDRDIWQTAPGFTGIQTCLPLFFDQAVNQRGLSLPQFAALTSANAARIFGLYPQKGSLEPGTDADVTIIDPRRSWTVRKEQLFYKQPWSPFIGRQLNAAIRATVVRGRIVHEAGRILAAPGYGRFVKAVRG